MSMTKKHYNAIAEKCKVVWNNGKISDSGLAVFDDLIIMLADIMQADNPNFNRDRFYSAIYKQQE